MTCYNTLRPGAAVLVRTRVGTLPTGQGLVLWLSAAAAVSPTDGGYEVVYKGEWPRGNPYATVHVARDRVKLPPTPEPPASAASSCASATTVAAAPMPRGSPCA